MILLLHILLAISSILFATSLFLAPSDQKFKANYFLLAATLASGTYLVIDRASHLVESCFLGLVYLGAVSLAIVSAKRKFAREKFIGR